MTFKKGQQVKFAIKSSHGITRGKGTVKALVPKNAKQGDARLTVVDADGVKRRPYPSQCKAA